MRLIGRARVGNVIQSIKSATQIWAVMRHQCGISALVSQTSFGEEINSSIAKINIGCFLRLVVKLLTA